jgi:hypothetical protein
MRSNQSACHRLPTPDEAAGLQLLREHAALSIMLDHLDQASRTLN